MTLGLFKTMLTDFLGVGVTVDSTRLLQIINMARDRIQRNYNLSFAKVIKQDTYPATVNTGYVVPADFKSFVSAKAVQIYNPQTTGWITCSGITQTQLETENVRPSDVLYQYYIQALATDTRLFIMPEPLSQTIKFRYNCWLAAYSGDFDTDFLLTRGTDVLLFESLKVLNLFLHNEERVQIDAAASAQALMELESFVNQLENNGASIGGY